MTSCQRSIPSPTSPAAHCLEVLSGHERVSPVDAPGVVVFVSKMATASAYPVGALEHSHERLNEFTREIGRLLRTERSRHSVKVRQALRSLTIELRQELLEHFANEEEGLFPFVREQVAAQAETVNRLEAAHDTICGAILRLAHLLARERASVKDALTVYRRFEDAYAEHSRDEAELLEWLGHVLSPAQRQVLAEYLRGLA